MKSRMDKYYKDEDIMQRTSKNDSLYEELYRQKQKERELKSLINILLKSKEIPIDAKIKILRELKKYGLI